MTEWLSITSIDKAVVFPVVTYGCESWIKKCWRRLLRVPWTAKGSNQSIWKEINSEYSLEGLMLKLKLRYFAHLRRKADSLEKTPMLGKIKGRRRRGHQRMRWLDGTTDSMDLNLANFGSWWGTGRPGVLQSVWLQRVRHTGQLNNEKPLTVNFWIQENYLNAKIMDFFLSCAISFQGSVNASLLLSFASWKRSREITFTLENCILDILKTVKCWLYQEPWPSNGICSSLHFKLKFFKKNFIFWSYHVACGILVLQPGIGPMPPVVEAWSLNHWTIKEFPSPF